MIRGSPDPFPIFEGGVRLRQTSSLSRTRERLYACVDDCCARNVGVVKESDFNSNPSFKSRFIFFLEAREKYCSK